MGQVVDIEIPKQLPTSEVVFVETKNKKQDTYKALNDSKKKLKHSDLEPLNLS
jgi:hypothetical protein